MNGGFPNATLVERYSRQMLVPQMDGMQGQLALHSGKVLIVGAGGIGSSAILYLAGAGVGSLTLVDFDVVEESNLHRQVIHDTQAAQNQTFKATSAAARVLALNPHITCDVVQDKLSRSNAVQIMTKHHYDVVVDATDNFEARYLINDTCNHLGLPLVSGSAVGMEGQVTVFQPQSGFACYRCLHPNPSPAEACRSCDNAGVVGPVPGVIGTLQAVEVIKYLVKAKTPLSEVHHSNKLKNLIGRQLYYDAASSEFHEFRLPQRTHTCISCRHLYSTSSPAEKEARADLLFPPESSAPVACVRVTDPLPREHRIKAPEYYSSILKLQVPHVLLDVRSTLQFNIISLKPLFPSCSTSSSDSIPEQVSPMQLVNIPYADLLAASRSPSTDSDGTGSDAAFLALQTLRNAVFHQVPTSVPLASGDPPPPPSPPLPVYVLCRRGVDSVKSTELLRVLLKSDTFLGDRYGRSTDGADVEVENYPQVFNIEGGLNAWHSEVDPSFPKY